MTVNIDTTIPSFTMTSTVAASTMSCNIPSLTAAFIATANKISMECSLEALIMTSKAGLELEGEIAKLTMTGIARNEILGILVTTLPSFSFLGYSEAQLDAEIPAFTMTGSAAIEVISNMAITLPMVVANIQAQTRKPTELEARLPSLKCVCTAYNTSLAQMAFNLPSFKANINAISGIKVDISATIPRFKASMDAYQEGYDGLNNLANLDIDIPLFKIEIRTSAEAEEVLQFVRGQLL